MPKRSDHHDHGKQSDITRHEESLPQPPPDRQRVTEKRAGRTSPDDMGINTSSSTERPKPPSTGGSNK
jgi:hypothetical protein